ncbi:hypothetical protein ACFQRK_23935 [Parapedobacter sp. GCM10030251]|uniref:hypothetical protein n=1 Tax=Parapedobacter sp. GCM10030251 TaxID=3273419 RepID=UPI00361030FE
MLFERLTLFIDDAKDLRYIRGSYQMEIWKANREELPVVVSHINNSRYVISSGDLIYEAVDEERAYRYILRFF